MATRNRRHRHVVDMLADPDNNVRSNENNARFDSGLSKNWTVAQLRAELSRNDISFNKSDKKLKLLQWFSPVHKATRGAAALIGICC